MEAAYVFDAMNAWANMATDGGKGGKGNSGQGEDWEGWEGGEWEESATGWPCPPPMEWAGFT